MMVVLGYSGTGWGSDKSEKEEERKKAECKKKKKVLKWTDR